MKEEIVQYMNEKYIEIQQIKCTLFPLRGWCLFFVSDVHISH